MASYEESRKKRVEENKKRMEELKLHTLSESLKKKFRNKARNSNSNSNSSSVVAPVRRSTRIVDKPPPNYKDYPLGVLGARTRQLRWRAPRDDFYASAEDRAYSIDRAHHLESTLPSQFPTFVKPMLHSHVTGGFWLSLPLSFCQPHLPDKDVTITLVDEAQHQWESKYLAYKNGLSGGWRTFSLDHHLRDGDALVFQLVQPLSFKVYIIRIDSNEQEQDKGPSGSDEVVNATELRLRKRSKRN